MKSFKQFLKEEEDRTTIPPDEFTVPPMEEWEWDYSPAEYDWDFEINPDNYPQGYDPFQKGAVPPHIWRAIKEWLERYWQSRNPTNLHIKQLHEYYKKLLELQRRFGWTPQQLEEYVRQNYPILPMEEHPDFVGPPSSLAEE